MPRNQDPSSRKMTPAKWALAIVLTLVVFVVCFAGARACTNAMLSAADGAPARTVAVDLIATSPA